MAQMWGCVEYLVSIPWGKYTTVHCFPMELLTKAAHGLRHSVGLLLYFGIRHNPLSQKLLGDRQLFSKFSKQKLSNCMNCPLLKILLTSSSEGVFPQ